MKKAQPRKTTPTHGAKHNTKLLAQGNWQAILTRFGADTSCLDGRHHPCPACGGTDRFRFDDNDGSGSHICSQCGAGDGFSLIQKMGGYANFKEAAKAIDDLMGWSGEPLSSEQKQAYQCRLKQQLIEREEAGKQAHRITAKACLAIWEGSAFADNTHPYLIAKGVQAFGVKIYQGKLLVPVRVNNEISCLQYIDADGGKMFHKGGNVSGGCCFIAGKGAYVVCEGYATGASIYEATGNHVLIAFNAGNLGKVTKVVRSKFLDAEIIIAADNDQKTDVNTGLDKALEAAQAVDGMIALPAGKQGTSVDWNDIHQQQGLDIVAAGIANAVAPNILKNDKVDCNGVVGSKVVLLPNNHNDSKPIRSEKTQLTDPLLVAVERLAGLSPLEYDQVRTSEAEALGVRTATLDAEVKAARKAASSESDIFPEIEPWGDVVDGEQLLDDMVSIFKRYAILPDHAPEVAALWILNTYVHDAGYNSPMIMITSPEKRCGKTTTLNLFQALVHKPLPAGNISPAAIYRAIEKWQPALLIDEADTFLKNNEEVAGVINSGHTKPSAFVIRCDGENNEPKQFSTWCPKIIAGIGSQRDTLEDRSIIFPLRRKLPHEQVERLRLDRDGFDDLKRKCVRWAADNFTNCKNSDPMPIQELEDRANDNWSPLLAIADLCNWGEKARMAAVLIRGEVEQSESIDTILLKDIQTIFNDQQVERLASQRICELLAMIDDRPWSEWSKGRSITTNKLAGRLKSFGVHSKVMRLPNGDNLKGYELGAFSDAFTRYCDSNRHNVTSYTQPQELDFQSVTNKEGVTVQKDEKPIHSNGCDVVTVQSRTAAKGHQRGAF
ncbi:MAG: hypothetical protein COC22_03800 [Flavobacteriaceae bacterium]|nr:MAG: hypothetical protein COC22_03800 [Flavobacteriaceae bacterium]